MAGERDGLEEEKGFATLLSVRFAEAGLKKIGRAEGLGPSWPLDSVVIRAHPPEQGELVWAFAWGDEAFTLEGLSAADGVRFSAEVRGLGQALYRGEAEADLAGDRVNRVELTCLPQASRLTAAVQWPVDAPGSVAGGRLEAIAGDGQSFAADLERQGDFLLFFLDALPGDRSYRVRVGLWDVENVLVADAEALDVRVPMGESLHLNLALRLTRLGAVIGLVLPAPQAHRLDLALPAGRQSPKASGTVVFAGILPSPSAEQGGSDGEWLALWSRSVDTLDLAACRILRDGGGSGTKATPLLPLRLPPGGILYLGKANAPSMDAPLEGLALTNAGGELELVCGEGDEAVSLDRIRYADQEGESIPVPAAQVAWRRAATTGISADPALWCLGDPFLRPGSGLELMDACEP